MSRYIPEYNKVELIISNVICNHCGETIKQKIDKGNFKQFDKSIKIVYNCPKCKNILVYNL